LYQFQTAKQKERRFEFMSQKTKLCLAIFLFCLAGILFVFRWKGISEEKNIPKEDFKPIALQPGKIQRIITKLEPVVPSGKVIEVDNRTSGQIQSVLDSAKPGDTILLKSGTYPVQLTLREGIILRGEDPNRVVLQGPLYNPILKIENCKTVEVSNLTLSHLPVFSNEIQGRWPVLLIRNSGAAVRHLQISGSASDGIRILNDNVHLNHVQITDCLVSNNKTAGILVLGNGNVEVKNTICRKNGTHGISLKGYADGILTGNQCLENGVCGIAVEENASVELFGNICSRNACDGIWHKSNSSLTAQENSCFENGYSGIEIYGQVHISLLNNRCSRNKENGIFLQGGVTGLIQANFCLDNQRHGISLTSDCAPSVESNTCTKNGKCGIYSETIQLSRNSLDENGEFCPQEIQMLLCYEDFDVLERTASRIQEEKRRFSNGTWQLEAFYSAFQIGYGDQPFEDNIRLCEKWLTRYPNSAAARIALAASYISQGWQIRGSGYSKTVAPEAWGPFHERLLKARELLTEAETIDKTNPALYSLWIEVAMGLGKIDEIETSFQKGVEAEPTYFSLYLVRGFAYLPRWYGTPGQYEKLAAQAAELTKDKLGQSLYFLLANQMVRYEKSIEQFQTSGFDYKRIQEGKKDFEKQFPDCLDIPTLNRLCFMACAAGDKEDARDYFLDIGDQWDKKIWQNFETFEKYKKWARNREN